METKRFLLAMATVLTLSTSASAQDKVETTISADFVSSYIWRGIDMGSTAIQPTLGVGYKGLSLSAWGSYALTNPADTKEFDLTLAYTIGGFSIGVTDYWFNVGQDPDARYFIYKAHKTNHVFEATVGYDFGFASLSWYTNIGGNDGLTKSGKRAYSSFAQVTVPFKLAGVEWSAQLGVVPYATTFYSANGFAVTYAALRATKDIRITDTFSLPLFAQITANPRMEMAYMTFGFTLKP